MLKKEQQLLKKGLLVGVGIAAYAQEKTEKFVKELIKGGRLNPAEGKKLVKNVYQEADRSRKKIVGVIESELKRLLRAAPQKKKTVKKKSARRK